MTTQREIAEARAEEVVSRFESGETISSIARDLGVRTTVVSQVVFDSGNHGRGRTGRETYDRRGRVLIYIQDNPGRTLQEVSDATEVSVSQIREILSGRPEKNLVVSTRKKSQRFSDEHIGAVLQQAFESSGKTHLSIADYERYRNGSSRRDDIPTLGTLSNRYGSWSAACAEFDIPAGDRYIGAGAVRQFDDEWLRVAVETFLEEEGKTGYRDYETWAAQDRSRPSASLVRRRLGRWSEIISAGMERLKAREEEVA